MIGEPRRAKREPVERLRIQKFSRQKNHETEFAGFSFEIHKRRSDAPSTFFKILVAVCKSQSRGPIGAGQLAHRFALQNQSGTLLWSGDVKRFVVQFQSE